MEFTKKQKNGIAFGILSLGLILLVIFWPDIFGKKEKCPNGKNVPDDGDCTKVMTPDQITNYANTGNVNTTSGGKPTPLDGGPTTIGNNGLTGCVQPSLYVPESFPLKKGMIGPNVGIVQKQLGGLKIDNKFGCLTENEFYKVFERTEISQTFFNSNFKNKK